MEKRVQVNIKRRFAGEKDILELLLPIICEDIRKILQDDTIDDMKISS